jgi:hypothetical protein
MYAEVIDDRLDLIRKDLVSEGLTYKHLQDDVVDHICCMVEEGMQSGKDFESSYRDVMHQINGNTFKSLQHETLIAIDKKFQRMKNYAYVLGLTGTVLTIAGVFFKVMHWPGASIVLTLGFLIIAAVFLPLYFILSYREQAEKPPKVYPVVAYITLLLVFTGAIFKIMHWPGANILLKASVGFMMVGFLPLYIVKIFKRTTGRKFNISYIILVLVGLSVVLVLSWVNLSKNSIDSYTDMAVQFSESTALLNESTDMILEKSGSQVTPEMQKITAYADELEALASRMLNGLLGAVDQAGVPIEEAQRRDYRRANREAFIDNGLGSEFKALAGEYRSYLLKVLDDPLTESLVDIDLLFSSDEWLQGWNPGDYEKEPMIYNYYRISQFRWRVVAAEYTAVRHLAEAVEAEAVDVQ